MKKTLTKYEMADMLISDEYAGWSRSGALALADYLDEFYSEDIEFDRVEIRCIYSEYPSLQQWALEYFGSYSRAARDLSIDEDSDTDDIDKEIRKFLSESTNYIEFEGGVIVEQF